MHAEGARVLRRCPCACSHACLPACREALDSLPQGSDDASSLQLSAGPHAAAAALVVMLGELPTPLLPARVAELADACAPRSATAEAAASGVDEEDEAEGAAAPADGSVCSSPPAAVLALASCGLPLPGHGAAACTSSSGTAQLQQMVLLRCVMHVARASLAAQGQAISAGNVRAEQMAGTLAQVLFPPLPDSARGAGHMGMMEGGWVGELRGRQLMVLQLLAAAEL